MPATVQPYVLRKLRGRNGSAPENIDDGQFQVLQNWYPKAGILKRRPGTSRVSGIAYDKHLTGCAVYLPSGIDYKVLVGLEDGIGELDGDEIAILPSAAPEISASKTLWTMKQYKNTMYCQRSDIGSIYRSDGTQINDSGIAAPTAALTATEGAAGNLAAGNYEIVYTYYNTNSGAESNPSPAATVTIAANKKINYSGITTTVNAQTNARKIYRSLVNQSGEWFHVLTILDNISTAYTGDNALLADMGLPAEQTNGLPPTNVDMIEVHQERLWATDGLLVYFSELGLPESFAATSSLNVKSDDGYLIRGLVSFGEILLILKQNGIYYIAGSDEQSFQVRTLHDRHGCVAAHSVAVGEGFAFWFGGDNFYLTDGNRVNAIGSDEVRDIISNISSDDYDIMQADIYMEEGWYICGIPSNGAVTSWLAYNYRTGDWHTMTWDPSLGAPQWIRGIPDINGKPIMYGAHSGSAYKGHLFQEFDTEQAEDFGFDIACTLKTKNYGFNTEDSMKFMKDVQILISSTGVAESMTVTLFRDDDAVAEDTASVSTYSGKMWKRIPVANPGYPGTFLSLKLDYSGDADFNIEGLGFKIVDLGRQAPVI
jgi:hypothetical protein